MPCEPKILELVGGRRSGRWAELAPRRAARRESLPPADLPRKCPVAALGFSEPCVRLDSLPECAQMRRAGGSLVRATSQSRFRRGTPSGWPQSAGLPDVALGGASHAPAPG